MSGGLSGPLAGARIDVPVTVAPGDGLPGVSGVLACWSPSAAGDGRQLWTLRVPLAEAPDRHTVTVVTVTADPHGRPVRCRPAPLREPHLWAA